MKKIYSVLFLMLGAPWLHAMGKAGLFHVSHNPANNSIVASYSIKEGEGERVTTVILNKAGYYEYDCRFGMLKDGYYDECNETPNEQILKRLRKKIGEFEAKRIEKEDNN